MKKPKIVFMIDINGWAYDQHASFLQKYIEDFEILIVPAKQINEYDLSDIALLHIVGFSNIRFVNIFDKVKYTFSCNSERALIYTDEYNEIIRKAEGIIGINNKLTEISKKYNSNVKLINNGIDTDIFYPNRDESTDFTVGFSGNCINPEHDKLKGYSEFVVPACKKAGVKLNSLLFGVNQIPQSEMPKWYNSISVLVSMSETEGDSQTINSAMACKTPIISTKTGTLIDYGIDNVNYFEVKRDVEDLCVKLTKARDNRELRNKVAQNGYLLAREKHNPIMIAEKYNDFFKNII